MRTFIAFLLGLFIGAGVVWVLSSPRNRAAIEAEARDVRRTVEEKAPVVKERLERTGEAVADATADARTSAAIKVKLATDPDLSALQISVDTTAGIVTLAGKVKSPELIEKAVTLAKSVEGVREVKQTLQVDPGK